MGLQTQATTASQGGQAVRLETKGLELGKKTELGTLEDTGRTWAGCNAGNSRRNQGPGWEQLSW